MGVYAEGSGEGNCLPALFMLDIDGEFVINSQSYKQHHGKQWTGILANQVLRFKLF